jgi:hypothetical protein
MKSAYWIDKQRCHLCCSFEIIQLVIEGKMNVGLHNLARFRNIVVGEKFHALTLSKLIMNKLNPW